MLMHRSACRRSVRGVLDEGDDPASHEAGGAHRCPRPGDLGHLHHPAHGADVDAPPGSRGAHLIGPGPVPGVDHDLDAVPFHGAPFPHEPTYVLGHTTPPTGETSPATSTFGAVVTMGRAVLPNAARRPAPPGPLPREAWS